MDTTIEVFLGERNLKRLQYLKKKQGKDKLSDSKYAEEILDRYLHDNCLFLFEDYMEKNEEELTVKAERLSELTKEQEM